MTELAASPPLGAPRGGPPGGGLRATGLPDRLLPPDEASRERIRTDLRANLFVEAGAGSGKTTMLVERVLALVAAGVPLAGIAAITFTEKAASELRDRLRTALVDGAEAPGTSPEVRFRYAGALDEIDGAPIGTLHAFAQRLLREHPLDVGLPPAIEVLDELASEIAFDRRWRDHVQRLLDDRHLERSLLLAAAAEVRLPQLRDLARAFAAEWDLVAEQVDPDPPEPPRLDPSAVVAAVRALVAARQGVADDDRLSQRVDELGAWAATLDTDDELAVLAALRRMPSTRVAATGAWRAWGSRDAIRDVRVGVQELERLRDEVVQPVLHAALHHLAAALRAFTLEGATTRQAAGALEFHDLLVLARDLLRRDDGRVHAVLRERYRCLLVDEFQDTDPIQLELAVRLAAAVSGAGSDWWALTPEPGRLFLVGDPKQSIYRFRRADIAMYLRARDRLGADRVVLDANFRTVEPIIGWVNHVFATLITPVPDAQPEYQPLQATRAALDEHPAVAVLGVTPHVGPLLADELRAREAADVAAAVRLALDEGWLVHDAEVPGERRPARPGDITILLPARTSLPALEEALEAAGLPYRTESSSLVYAAPEIRALLLTLRALADPTDELSLVAALRSSLFGCSDVDLFRWVHERGGRWSWWQRRGASVAEGDDDPVGDALAYLAAVAADVPWTAPSQLLGRLVRDRRVLEAAVDGSRTRDVWRRVRFVIDQARAWSDAGGTGLREYLEWATAQSSEGRRVAEVVLPETDHDAVRVMTIHAAKGLEFPITVVSGLTTAQRGPRSGVRVLFPPDGSAVQLKAGKEVKTREFDAAQLLDEQLDEHERRRLLYVACTRARDHLVVSLHRVATTGSGDTTKTSAMLLADAAGAAPHQVALSPVLPAVVPGPSGPVDAEPWAWADRATWAAARAEALTRSRRAGTVAATTLARRAAELAAPAPATAEPVDPGLEKDAVDLELPPWQRGRYGTAVGRAVHAVLQTVDLATGAGLAEAARAQAAAEGVLGKEEVIEALARSALASSTVRDAVTLPFWREVYIAAPIGDTLLEGYVDLLYRTPEGLVVVDYKTDHVAGDDDVAAKVARYRLQGAAYARAVTAVTGEPVCRCVFVFCSPEGAREAELADLPAALADVDARLAAAPAP
jgi:ATP-dependent exoDNAse (exonuclease V) beta subunit